MDRTRRQDVLRAEFRLKSVSRATRLGNPSSPLDDLIYIILSGQTDEAKYKASFRALKTAFRRWEDVADARVSSLERVIAASGLGKQKAKYIKRIIHKLNADFGRPTLAPLRRMTTAEAESYLVSLPGVGPKTAKCVLLYTMHRDVFPADVNCMRIMERLGWIQWRGRRAELLARVAEGVVPPPLRRSLHISLVQLGRQVCTPSKPRCHSCCLADLCTHGRRRKATRPTVVDLCCGAGGFSWGFAQAGFEILLGVDQSEYALSTYEANLPGVSTLATDITQRDTYSRVAAKLRGHSPNVVIAGPPCQGFSRAGPRLADDPRNFVLRATLKLAVDLEPAMIVVENVPAIRGKLYEHHIRRALGVLRSAGYRFVQSALRASCFGVPQSRSRYILIAARDIERQDLNQALACLSSRSEVPGMTVRRAFANLPADTARNGHIQNHESMSHGARVRAKIRRIRPGTGPLSYRKLHPGQLAPTLICGNRALPCHFDVSRTITAREAARVQGFPDEYVFCGPRGAQMQQVADAVPPPLALGVGVAALKLLSPRSPAAQAAMLYRRLERPAYAPAP